MPSTAMSAFCHIDVQMWQFLVHIKTGLFQVRFWKSLFWANSFSNGSHYEFYESSTSENPVL